MVVLGHDLASRVQRHMQIVAYTINPLQNLYKNSGIMTKDEIRSTVFSIVLPLATSLPHVDDPNFTHNRQNSAKCWSAFSEVYPDEGREGY